MRSEDLGLKEQIAHSVARAWLPSSQLLSLSLSAFDTFYLGFILQSEDRVSAFHSSAPFAAKSERRLERFFPLRDQL